MIALGADPDIAEVESLTPHYDKLKYPGGKLSSEKRENMDHTSIHIRRAYCIVNLLRRATSLVSTQCRHVTIRNWILREWLPKIPVVL